MFTIQQNFNKGELSPKLFARNDIEHWKGACAGAVNELVMRQGGITRRPGFAWQGYARVDGTSRLLPFVFSRDEAYVLELGAGRMRVWSPTIGLVMDGMVPYVAEQPWLDIHLHQLQFAQSGDILFVTHRLYPPVEIRRYGATDWRCVYSVREDGPYMKFNKGTTRIRSSSTGDVSLGGTPFGTGFPALAFDGNKTSYWTAGTYDDAEIGISLPNPTAVCGYVIKAAPQVFATLAQTYDDGTPKTGDEGRPSFAAPRSWRFEAFDGAAWVTLDQQYGITGWGEGEARYFSFQNQIQYLDYRFIIIARNDSIDQREYARIAEIQLQGYSTDAGLTTLDLTSTDEVNAGRGFLPSDVGRHLRVLTSDASFTWMVIEQVNSTTQAIASVRGRPTPRPETHVKFRLGAFSETTGYPQTVAFYKERLGYACTFEQPQTLWLSKTGDYYDYGTSEPVLATDAMTLTFDEEGEIRFMAETQELAIGTIAAARTVGVGQDGTIGPTSFTQRKHVGFGFSRVQPINVGNALIAPSLYGTDIREFKFDIGSSSFKADSISVLSDHLFFRSVKQMAQCQEPNGLVWFLMDDGHLVSMTYEQGQRMIAFNPHRLGGNGTVESICSIPGAGGDYLWAIVVRDGTSHIEKMTLPFETGDQQNAVYLDGAAAYAGPPTTSVSGLSFLEGKDVHILADGAMESREADDYKISRDGFKNPGYVPTNKTVVGASVNFDDKAPASAVTVGLPYFSGVETMRVTFSQAGDAGLGRKARTGQVIFDVYKTGDLLAWTPDSKVPGGGTPTKMIQRELSSFMDKAIPIYSGTIDPRMLEGGWDTNGRIAFGTTSPYPMTVRAVLMDVESE